MKNQACKAFVLLVAIVATIAICITLARAQDKPPASEPPTVESLQRSIAEKDSQIASLSQQIAQLNGNLAALNKLYGACYQTLSADEAQLAKLSPKQ